MSFIFSPPASSGGTPSGSNTQVQFNDSGAFGGDSGLTYNKTTDALTVVGSLVTPQLLSSASSNQNLYITPFGTGAISAQIPDSTAVGGNARGTNSVDLQMTRSAANQVASAANSFAAGRNNIASGINSVAIGFANTSSGDSSVALGYSNAVIGNLGSFAAGLSNNVSGQASGAIGNSNNVTAANCFVAGGLNDGNGTYSVVLGGQGNAKSIESILIVGSPIYGVTGKCQSNILNIGIATTNAISTVLKSSIAVVSTFNQLMVQNNSALAFTGLIEATVTGGGNSSAWEIKGLIKRGANAASTALVGSATVSLISQDSGASSWAVAVTADTTNGCLAVTVTGQASTTIRWNCTLYASEVAF